VVDPATRLKTLRPDATIRGSGTVIVSNSLGLRSDEIASQRSPRELRIAVIGASTVMGTYSRSNADTFPAQMQRILRQRYPDRPINVINAGIVGYSLQDERNMLDKIVLPLSPDIVLIYPGGNDFTSYCRAADQDTGKPRYTPRPLPKPFLPGWWMSGEMLRKNTVFLRPAPPSSAAPAPTPVQTQAAAPAARDFEPELRRFAAELDALISTAKKSGVAAALIGSAYAYRPAMPRREIEALSATARYYAPCFDVDSLMALQSTRNELMRAAATSAGAGYIDMNDLLPGGTRYFGDAAHFTPAGEDLAAQGLVNWLDGVTAVRAVLRAD
jgi:lysophospholipase L1-like esterase